jgi:hypothetical protein
LNVGSAYQAGKKGQQAGRQISASIPVSRDGRRRRQAGWAQHRGMEAGEVRQSGREGQSRQAGKQAGLGRESRQAGQWRLGRHAGQGRAGT